MQDEDLESIGNPDPFPSFGPVFVDMAWNESIRWARQFYDGRKFTKP